MKATFYKFINGHVQRDVIARVENHSKSELLSLADLRHPVLTRREFYDVLSTDINGNLKEEFELMTHSHLIIVNTK